MVDSGWIGSSGVPMGRNICEDSKDSDFYFTYHHSAGDSMTMMDPVMLDKNVVAISSLMYLLADSEVPLPRD